MVTRQNNFHLVQLIPTENNIVESWVVHDVEVFFFVKHDVEGYQIVVEFCLEC